MEQMVRQLDSIRNERDAAIATLHQHGISNDKEFRGHVANIQALRAQNEELRLSIKQMRVELEHLSDISAQKAEQIIPAANYVRYMEEEVRKVKAENRQLLEQLQPSQGAAQRKTPTPSSTRAKKAKQLSPHAQKQTHTVGEPQEQKDSTVVAKHRDHLIALSDTIASLQKEKGQLENREREWTRKIEILEQRLKEQEEMVYNS